MCDDFFDTHDVDDLQEFSDREAWEDMRADMQDYDEDNWDDDEPEWDDIVPPPDEDPIVFDPPYPPNFETPLGEQLEGE